MNDLTELYENYKGEWVALKPDESEVVAHGKSAAKVWQQAKKLVNKPILIQIPSEFVTFIG